MIARLVKYGLVAAFLTATLARVIVFAQAQMTPPALSLAMPVPSSAETVTYVTKGTLNTSQTTSPATDTSLTIPSGTNQTLVMFVTTVANITPSVTWNGTSMGTAIEANYDGGSSTRLSIFCLANPATGNNTTSVTWTGSMLQLDFIGVVYSGTHQAAPCKNGNSAVISNGTSVSVGVTSAVGDSVAAMGAGGSGAGAAPSGTQLYLATGQPFVEVQGQYTAGASGTVTSTFNSSTGTPYGHAVGLDIAAGP